MFNSSTILVLMIAFPIVGSVLNGLILKPKLAKRAGMIATIFACLSFICALILFFSLGDGHASIRWSIDWFSIGAIQQKWGFKFDALTAVMALVVTGIGSLIHLYSIGYMSEEAGPSRYFAYLNLFLFNMLVLISSDNLLGLFVGWEGVGLCSYLLIGYWFEDPEKAKAGMKAFLVNRIGDAGFLIGMFICFSLFGSLEFDVIAGQMAAKNYQFDLVLLNVAAFFLFVGATGKSAQLPLYVWLPDAMAGPTPVSALIHAATMVTAGVYLIARMNFLFMVTSDTNLIIAWIGISTAIFAALIATCQRDIKKVLAYSTVSQLGLMFLAVGCKAYFAAVFHLVTHAFFKALLFLGAGSVIHGLHHEQNICNMGGLRKKMPLTFLTCLIATAAICGIPPLSGFFSKDTILYSALLEVHSGTSFWILGLIASTLTAFYMTRLFILVFLGEYRGEAHPHESPGVMLIPLFILAGGSALTGFLGVPHGLHFLPNFMEHFLSSVLPTFPEEGGAVSEHAAMIIATGLAICGILTAYFFYSKPQRAESAGKALKPIQLILSNKFWVDELYHLIFVLPFKGFSYFLARFVDSEVIDGLVLLPGRISNAGAFILNFLQTGAVQFYLFIMVVGALVLFWVKLKVWVF